MVDKGKKVKVSPEDENSEQLDGEIIHSIEKLQELQDELDKINEEASEKVLEVEQKYNEVRRPIYEKRSKIINSIPDFWLSAFLSHPALASLLTDEDHKIFKYFSSLEVEECIDVKSGYSITFNFRPNPYFEDTKLTKTYTYLDEGITNVTATEIKWKEGMGIQNGVTRKKGKKRSLEEESFFNWFSSSKQDETTGEIQDQVAEILKDEFWPQPLNFFNNDGDDEEDEDADEDDDENGDGSDDDEDEDDEEDDENDEDDEEEGEGGN